MFLEFVFMLKYLLCVCANIRLNVYASELFLFKNISKKKVCFLNTYIRFDLESGKNLHLKRKKNAN